MELINLEKDVTTKIKTCFNIVSGLKKRKSLDYKLIYSYHVSLSLTKGCDDIFNKPNEYFLILSLIINGKINFDGCDFDFSNKVQNQPRVIRFLYYLVTAFLITLEYLETNNFYKAVRNQFNNYEIILEQVISNEEFDENIRVNMCVFRLLNKKIDYLLSNLYKTI